MTNLEIMASQPEVVMAAYEAAKANITEKKHINTGISLNEQLKNFEATSFTDEEVRALHEDLLSV